MRRFVSPSTITVAAMGILVTLLCGTVAHAEIEFETTRLELGTVSAKAPPTIRFPYRVTGTAPAEIRSIRPGCGCLKSSWTAKSLAPGETGVIPLALDATSLKEGPKRFQLTVLVADPTPRTIELFAEAIIETDLDVEPSGLLFMLEDSGTHLSPGREIRRSIVVRDRRLPGLVILRVESTHPAIQVERASGRQVEVILRTDQPPPLDVEGRWEGVVVIHTDDLDYPRLEIACAVHRPVAIRAIPDRIVCRPRSASPTEHRIVLQDRRGRPIRIDRVVASHPAIQIETQPSRDGSGRLRVQVAWESLKSQAETMPQAEAARIVVHVAEPISMQLVIPIQVEWPRAIEAKQTQGAVR